MQRIVCLSVRAIISSAKLGIDDTIVKADHAESAAAVVPRLHLNERTRNRSDPGRSDSGDSEIFA